MGAAGCCLRPTLVESPRGLVAIPADLPNKERGVCDPLRLFEQIPRIGPAPRGLGVAPCVERAWEPLMRGRPEGQAKVAKGHPY